MKCAEHDGKSPQVVNKVETLEAAGVELPSEVTGLKTLLWRNS